MSIVAEAPGYMQVFSDGSVKRVAIDFVPGNSTHAFKDVTIDTGKPIARRLFLPDTQGSADKLPVMVYFHGGGFCICSTTWLGYHHFLGDFSIESKRIVLSIDYRLASENWLLVAYDDCYSSLEWLGQKANSEPWLKLADLSRVFLSGDSAGGNITHQVAILSMRSKDCNVKVRGLLLIHPYFENEKRAKKEMDGESSGHVAMNDMFWQLSIPKGSNRYYYGCNLEMQNVSTVEWSEFPAVAIYVAGRDFLNEKGVMYSEFLAKKGVKEVELVEAEGESRVSCISFRIRGDSFAPGTNEHMFMKLH